MVCEKIVGGVGYLLAAAASISAALGGFGLLEHETIARAAARVIKCFKYMETPYKPRITQSDFSSDEVGKTWTKKHKVVSL